MASSGIIDISNFPTFTAVKIDSDLGHIKGPIIIPQAAQIVFQLALEDGKVGHMVMYGRYAGAFSGTTTQAQAILTALTTGAAWTALAAFLSNTVTASGVSIRDVNVKDQPVITAPTPGPGGTSVSPSLPNEVALAITLRTAKVGRGNRGRIYFPGWATNALGTGNVAAAGAVTALGNWAQTIPSAFSGQGYTFSLGQKERAAYTSPITGTNFPHRDANALPITGQVVRDNHWDSQRRRGLK